MNGAGVGSLVVSLVGSGRILVVGRNSAGVSVAGTDHLLEHVGLGLVSSILSNNAEELLLFNLSVSHNNFASIIAALTDSNGDQAHALKVSLNCLVVLHCIGESSDVGCLLRVTALVEGKSKEPAQELRHVTDVASFLGLL